MNFCWPAFLKTLLQRLAASQLGSECWSTQGAPPPIDAHDCGSAGLPAPESTLGVMLQFATWTLSALDTFGCYTERHFKNSGFNCYRQKTSIKICICTPHFMQMVNLLPVNNLFFFVFFFPLMSGQDIVCMGTRCQKSILFHLSS